MDKYLLLRDNRQTGPHSFEEMVKLGFRKYDLVWVEGKSAAWRYAGEIAEFKTYATLVEEQPYDRFFKRKVAPAATEEQPNATIATPVEKKQKPQTASELLRSRRVAITMPANRSTESPAIVTQRKEPVAGSFKHEMPDPPKISAYKPEPLVAKASEMPPVEPLPINTASAPVETGFSTLHSHYLPGVAPAPPDSDAKVKDDEPAPLTEISYKPAKGDYTGLLQYVGVAAALVSLLLVGILIGQGMGNDQTPPPPTVNEQPSRIAELKKKLMETPLPETPGSVAEDEIPDRNTVTAAVHRPVKTNTDQNNKNLSVPASYQSSAETPSTDADGIRESVKRSSAPETAKADLASMLSVSLNEYKVNMFGGIDGIEVTVKNGADVPVAEALVELRYILSNRNKKHITETVVFTNLSPGESRTLPGPKSAKGIKLEYSLISAR
jgi:hypothetical protein